ncbi:MAG: 50S ribosomal protein L3 [Candidatus Nanohaloarchaeota archaeon QJJ-5]|nr:50S ribosomal protein L3 [Candidatus Nanohaloarchaeota archaeon QJJ-5]
MAKKSHPRRGSLGYKPQKRADRLYPTIDTVKDTGEPKALGFAGYKAGMTRVLRIEDRQDSEQQGQEVADAVTVLECPPLRVYGIRFYQETIEGKQVAGDVLADEFHDELERAIDLPDSTQDADIESYEEEATDIRLLVHTQPYRTGIDKKKPEVFELPLGGSFDDKLETAREHLGDEIRVSDVVDEGEYLDIIGVTQGKGIEGPVKRHGVKTLGRKSQKISRKAGNLGPWHPDHTSWKVPQAGQRGNTRRTEHNKRLLEIDDDVERATPNGGFTGYGELNNEYILVKGSVPGPSERLIMLRSAVRKDSYPQDPEITHIES